MDSIAKHYGVSTDELRKANELPPGALLKIGQRLTVPSSERSEDSSDRPRSAAADKGKPAIVKASLSTRPRARQRHRVMHGETLAQIAVRYGVSTAALSASSGLERNRSVVAGQLLTLPSSAKPVKKSWQPYLKPVKKKGYVNVSTPISRFTGPVLDADGRLRTPAVRALNGLLGAGGAHPALPQRLIRLLVEVSDAFGGRPIRLVSGYRTASYYQDSRHKLSSAIDFLIVGVPNAVVCDYLRELEDVGVGYYPNSSFVHLDVRNQFAYWVDYAGPGEPPRSTPNAPAAPRSADRKLLAELEGLLARAKGAIQEVRARRAAAPAAAPKPDRKTERERGPRAEPSEPSAADPTSDAGIDAP